MRTAGVLLILMGLPSAQEATVIEMKREAEVGGNIIRLEDVARVHDARLQEREQLEAIYVTLAPAPGQVKTVALREVRRRLRAHGVNLARVILEGPVTTRVRRGAQTTRRQAAPPSALADLVTRFVAGKLGREAADVRVTFDAATAERLRRLAARDLRWAVTEGLEPVRLGHNALGVVGYEGTQRRERLTVSAEVEAYCAVPVAARNIARRTRLAPADLQLERRLVGDPDSAGLTPSDLVGRLAARAIAKGATIEPEMVVDIPLVRRGDVVTVIARAGHIEVKTVGVALEEGTARQTVKVRNVDTRKVFAARVEAARTVVMEVSRSPHPQMPAMGAGGASEDAHSSVAQQGGEVQ